MNTVSLFKIKEIKQKMISIYQPAEDSYLLSETLKKEIPKILKKNPNLNLLEIGSGSGILLQTAFNIGVKKENIFGTDINENAVKCCKDKGFNCIKSDLFKNFRFCPHQTNITKNLMRLRDYQINQNERESARQISEPLGERIAVFPSKFDIIIFNPPYLPLDEKEPEDSQIATTGGKKGNEFTIKFLKDAKDYLNKNGRIFVVTSSLSKEVNFEKLGYKSKVINSKKLFFEELVVRGLVVN